MSQEVLELERNIFLKSQLLLEGCDVCNSITELENFQKKRIHLYAHSIFKDEKNIPDDIIIGENNTSCIVRLRFNPNSRFKIILKDNKFYLSDVKEITFTPINLLPEVSSDKLKIDDLNSVSSICSFLGSDLLGIAPSNHCFYFRKKEECRFCEIWENYKDSVEYEKPLKNPEIIKKAVQLSLQNNKNVRHLAITSGNIKNYDFTTQFFATIGSKINKLSEYNNLQDVLGTLMPPDNFELIKEIKNSGFNKIYFPLEVFDKNLFKIMCPGKYKYGYEKIIDALEFSVDIFGKGNVYTNFVYGIQSLDISLKPDTYDPVVENENCLLAVDRMLEKKIVPVFTVYHYSGYNKIGEIKISEQHMFEFFKTLGMKIFYSNLIPYNKEALIFSNLSLSNTMYNECFKLAKLKGNWNEFNE